MWKLRWLKDGPSPPVAAKKAPLIVVCIDVGQEREHDCIDGEGRIMQEQLSRATHGAVAEDAGKFCA